LTAINEGKVNNENNDLMDATEAVENSVIIHILLSNLLPAVIVVSRKISSNTCAFGKDPENNKGSEAVIPLTLLLPPT